MDASHPLFNNLNGYKWQLKGKENTQLALSNEGRKRLTILSAYNPHTFSTTTIFTENTCNQEMICLFLKEIKNEYPDAENIHIVLDNAYYHRAKNVREMARENNIELNYRLTALT